jgi:LacI family repressor for deo operon, udp, cdd, tsx, nupC, and nupG
VTIHDVAKEAKVSISSVSRYLNSPWMLNQDKVDRIRDAIKKLNYRPSALAVSMRTQKTKMIALIIPTFTNMYYIDLYSTFREVTLKHGYSLNLYTTERNPDELYKYLEQIPQRNYDGAIIAFLDEAITRDDLLSAQEKYPLILLTSDPHQEDFNNVFIDAYDAMYKAASHLISLGRKRIAFISGAPDSVISHEKFKGFETAMREAGRSIDHQYLFYGEKQHFDSGIAGASKFLSMKERPDGIVCSTDDIGIGCMKKLLQEKVRIPEEIAVVSFNGISVLRSFEPEITTVAQPIAEIADALFGLLLENIENKKMNRKKICFKAELRIRNSTVPAGEIHDAR